MSYGPLCLFLSKSWTSAACLPGVFFPPG
jgi:hypothetical protein